MSTKADKLAANFGASLSGIVGINRGAAAPPAPAPAAVDKYGGAVKSKTFAEIPLAQVDRDPTQPREEFEEADLQRLAASIARRGQLQPIRVTPGAEPGRWVVLVGERRFRACKLAGLATIKAEFVEGAITEADRLEEQIYENVARDGFKPAEEGRAYRRLMTMKGWAIKDLVGELDLDPTKVHRALGLARLPDDVADLVDAGEIRPTAAYELSKLEDPAEVRALAAVAIELDLDHKAIVAAVATRKARGAGKGGKAHAKPQRPTFEVIRAGGAKITVEFKKAVEPRAVLDALQEAADRQREKVGAIEGDGRDAA